jgi:mannose PTS system EIID component
MKSGQLQKGTPIRPGSLKGSGWNGLFHLEGLYNSRGQQRGGLLWGLLRIVPGKERDHPVLAALARGGFNTNPVLAPYLIALLSVRLRRSAADCDEEETGAAVERLRSTLAPLLAGVGDRIFWGGVRPVVSLLGILSAMLWVGEPALWVFLGYNAVALYWRRRAWKIGLLGEEEVGREIRERRLEKAAARWAWTGRFLVGLTLGVAVAGVGAGQGWPGALTLILLCAAGAGLARVRRVSPLLLGWIGVAVAGLLALLHAVLGRTTA